MNQEDILRHIAAMEAIIGMQQTAPGTSGTTAPPASATGGVTLTTSQIQQLRTHLAELRRLTQK
jgi:hypothetical protein